MISMSPRALKHVTRAIVQFGPATATSGFRPAEFYQVILDPAKQSPNGQYIRFDHATSEIHGWQRIEALTVCEVLETLEPSPETITVMVID